MISRIEGTIAAVHEDGTLELQCEHLTYALLIPATDIQQLSSRIGSLASFYTLHYLEGQGQGSSYLPRLIGFQSPQQRAFFELFTSVRGMGNRKALRALQLPFGRIAEAIAARDIDLLKTLPEIGKRTAETIIVELREKVDHHIELKPATAGGAGGGDQPDASAAAGRSQAARDAVEVLTQLGETRLDATRLVDKALTASPELSTADEIIAAAFGLREGAPTGKPASG